MQASCTRYGTAPAPAMAVSLHRHSPDTGRFIGEGYARRAG